MSGSFVKYVDAGTDRSGELLELRWRSSPFEHFDLKQFDGEVETRLAFGKSDGNYLLGACGVAGS